MTSQKLTPGRMIRNMRVTRGITRSQLAILANVSDTTIMRIEQDRKMTLDSYVAVWAALDPDAIATVGEFASFAEELKA